MNRTADGSWYLTAWRALNRPSPTRACACRRCAATVKERSLLSMSAVLVAIFEDHATAEGVRTRFVQDGFPTDRVDLTSCQELGPAKLVPREGVGAKLAEYFRKLF